jgi:hypothetical protein
VTSGGTWLHRVWRSKLMVPALTSLLTFALLASAVAHGRGPYGFEDPVSKWLGAPSTTATWANLAERLGAPSIGVALLASVVLGVAKGALGRVAIYASFAAVAFLASDLAKPLVQRTYYSELTFPSGSVTAVCAVALAMWLALSPSLGKRARSVVLVIGTAWTVTTALAVVGALWHTPLDDVGSLLLSAGVVTAGAAVFEHSTTQGQSVA